MGDLRQDVMHMLNRINRKVFTASGKKAESLLGIGQINILKEIMNNEEMSQDSLATKLELDKTTIAKAVKRLETKGLITRKRNKNDQRKKQLMATEKAFDMKLKMTNYMIETTEIFFDGISDEEVNTFKSTLEKIEINIEKRRTLVNNKKTSKF